MGPGQLREQLAFPLAGYQPVRDERVERAEIGAEAVDGRLDLLASGPGQLFRFQVLYEPGQVVDLAGDPLRERLVLGR